MASVSRTWGLLSKCLTLNKSMYHLRTENVCRHFSLNAIQCASIADRNSWVVLSNDGRTIVCWHPETAPPYEHTKPIPKFQADLQEGDSVLKVQYLSDVKHVFKPGGPTDEELAKLTYTTTHRWRPKSKKNQPDPNPPRDREGM